MATKDDLKEFLNAISKEKYTPGAMAKRFGTKANVTEKAIAALDLLEQHRPPFDDKEAFDLWSSAKERLTNQLKATKEYARTLPESAVASNVDELNHRGYIKVAAKDPAGKILEKEASQIDPHLFREQQRIQRTIAPGINDVQKLDIGGAKRRAIEELATKSEQGALKMASKGASTLGHMKGMGKIAALGSLIGAVGKASAGEPIEASGMAEDAANAFMPPVMDALMPSTTAEQQLSPEQIAQYQAEMKAKSDEARMRKQEMNAGALEFGDKLDDMQSQARRQAIQNMSSKIQGK